VQSFVDQASLKAIDIGFDLQPVSITATASCCAT
jgi:hypothetical protein